MLSKTDPSCNNRSEKEDRGQDKMGGEEEGNERGRRERGQQMNPHCANTLKTATEIRHIKSESQKSNIGKFTYY